MCGKFTAMASWREVVACSQPLTISVPSEGSNDQIVSYGVMQPLPVIVCDADARQRRFVTMRWGFAEHKMGWKIPKPMHARAEAIDTTKSFVEAFNDSQRGIVVFRTFNEGEELVTERAKPIRSNGPLTLGRPPARLCICLATF